MEQQHSISMQPVICISRNYCWIEGREGSIVPGCRDPRLSLITAVKKEANERQTQRVVRGMSIPRLT
jgi:hypothetical protein